MEEHETIIHRQKRMAALIGGIFGVLALFVFSFVLLSYFWIGEYLGLISSRTYEGFMEELFKVRWIFLIDFLIFTILSVYGGVIIERRLKANKPFWRVGLFWCYLIFLSAMGTGVNLLRISDVGIKRWMEDILAFEPGATDAAFFVILISILPTLVFGPLLAFAIRQLRNTNGFGLPHSN